LQPRFFDDIKKVTNSQDDKGFGQESNLKAPSKRRLKALEGKLTASGKYFAIVVSRFNAFYHGSTAAKAHSTD